MDAYIAATHGMPSCLFVGGDIACLQAERAVPGIVTVITKKELSRNKAIFRKNDELFEDIKAGVGRVMSGEFKPKLLSYPAVMEKSFKRVEDAAKYLERILSFGMKADYINDEILGKDAHTVSAELNSIEDFIRCV